MGVDTFANAPAKADDLAPPVEDVDDDDDLDSEADDTRSKLENMKVKKKNH